MSAALHNTSKMGAPAVGNALLDARHRRAVYPLGIMMLGMLGVTWMQGCCRARVRARSLCQLLCCSCCRGSGAVGCCADVVGGRGGRGQCT